LLRAGLLPALAAAALPGSEAWPVVLVRGGEVATGTIRDAVDSCRIGERVVVVVDQFEEIFADEVPAEERAAFFDELERAATDSSNRALVVMAVRADFYGRFADYPRIADRLSRRGGTRARDRSARLTCGARGRTPARGRARR
jgi:hypothetical protein